MCSRSEKLRSSTFDLPLWRGAQASPFSTNLKGNSMSSFEENLKSVPFSDKTVLLRIFNSKDELMGVLPNFPAKQGSLRVFAHVANAQDHIGRNEANAALQLFGEYVERAKQNPGVHQKLELLLNLRDGDYLRLERVESPHSNLLANIHDRKANAEETESFIELLNQGRVRAAEKVRDRWEPQTYVIDGVLNYFGTHPNKRLETSYWDKVPLKIANYTDQEFEASGVRYAPGSIVRTGAYIGPQTVVMNQAFVNIGAYIAGGGVMIDGGARVASCAQIGKGVKFGAGSGIEGILEPAGRLPSIVEDGAKIGAMCEVAGIVGEGAVVASGVIMASGKKIVDEDTGEVLPPLECRVGNDTFLLPVIPPYRLAVGGSLLSKNGRIATDAIVLKPGDLRDSATMNHFKKQGILYS
jgi:2,3,4,5-tetrahydropyridine-2,6-dicarboxylate N-succinyltransferase